MEEAKKAIKSIIDLVAGDSDDTKKNQIAKELRSIWGIISDRIKEETDDISAVPEALKVHVIRLRELLSGPVTQELYLHESTSRWTFIAYHLYTLLMEKSINIFTYNDLRTKIDTLTIPREGWSKDDTASKQEVIFTEIGDIYVKIK